jgi:hypothetical protein
MDLVWIASGFRTDAGQTRRSRNVGARAMSGGLCPVPCVCDDRPADRGESVNRSVKRPGRLILPQLSAALGLLSMLVFAAARSDVRGRDCHGIPAAERIGSANCSDATFALRATAVVALVCLLHFLCPLRRPKRV